MQDARRLLQFVRPYWRRAALALVMLALLVVFDLSIPRLIQRIIDQAIAKHDRALLIRTSGLMLGISAMSALIAITNNLLSVRVGESVARDLRERLFLNIQHYSFGNLDRQRTGQLLVRLTSDVNAVKGLTQVSLRIGTRAPLLMIGSIILMISTSPRLAFALLPLLLATAVLIGWFVTRMEPLFRHVQARLDGVNNVLQENIAGVRLVKAFVRADFEAGRFDVANEALTAQSIRVMRFMSTMTPLLSLCINVGVVIVLWFGGLQSIRGELSTGQIVAFINYLLTTMTPLVMLTMLSNMWASGFASLRRMRDVLDSVPDVQDAADATPVDPGAATQVVFDDVWFQYPGEDSEPVLRGVSFRAQAGQTVAILGATGAGKSTLVNLIPRFYDVTRGTVSVLGNDVRRLAQDSLIAHIGVVPQESLLFSGSVRDNIRYGRAEASDEAVIRAAQAAQADAFIERLPRGYDSAIEQRGANLSGGQRQRIAIARALLLEPAILILDDSTSAVDVETETKIQAALAEGKARRLTFLVAQRISTVLDADLILVLDKGRVVAEGTHAELMTRSDVYREIYDSQLGAAIDDLDLEGANAQVTA